MSPSFARIALARAGNHGAPRPVALTFIPKSFMPLEMLKHPNKVQPLCSPALGLPQKLVLEIWFALGGKNTLWIFKAH